MTENNDPLLLDHEADGIRELDNKLPRWWVWLFYCTIIFAVVYMSYYHVFAKGALATQGQMKAEYEAEMKIGDAIKSATMTRFETDIATLTPSKDPNVLARGQEDLPDFVRAVPPAGRRWIGRARTCAMTIGSMAATLSTT